MVNSEEREKQQDLAPWKVSICDQRECLYFYFGENALDWWSQPSSGFKAFVTFQILLFHIVDLKASLSNHEVPDPQMDFLP